MAIKGSGSFLRITEIVAEFGGSTPHSLSEYKRGGSLVPNSAANNAIPTTNDNISMSNFYGAKDTIFVNIPNNANLKELDITTAYATSQYGWAAGTPLVITFPSGIWIWSDNTSKAAIRIRNLGVPITINNYAKIIGRGGNGGGESFTNQYYNAQAGGPAIIVDSPNLTINNYSGAWIAGGGGGGGAGYGAGGGGGAGGGKGGNAVSDNDGGYVTYNGGAGGGLGASGSNGAGFSGYFGRGGGAGGEGGDNNDRGKKDNYEGAGGGGGRILPGVGGSGGGAGGNGGSNNSAGQSKTGEDIAGGGGGWGASGGSGSARSGAAGGRAIKWNSTVGTVTGSGTIYGAYT